MRIKTVNGIIAFFILVMPQFVFGQLTLKGHICDSETSIGIPYCSVIIKSIEQGTMTNESGYFEITLPNSCSEKQPIEISSLGYDPLHTELIDIYWINACSARATGACSSNPYRPAPWFRGLCSTCPGMLSSG